MRAKLLNSILLIIQWLPLPLFTVLTLVLVLNTTEIGSIAYFTETTPERTTLLNSRQGSIIFGMRYPTWVGTIKSRECNAYFYRYEVEPLEQPIWGRLSFVKSDPFGNWSISSPTLLLLTILLPGTFGPLLEVKYRFPRTFWIIYATIVVLEIAYFAATAEIRFRT